MRVVGRTVPAVGQDWHEALRARGYRLTPQRQLVLEAIGALGHPTPEEVLASVRQTAHAVNISTVYRTLELLEGLGLIDHAHLGHGAPTYSVASADDHVHLVCRGCGAVDEVPRASVAGVAEELRDRRGFEVDLSHLTVFGRCRACVEQARGDQNG